MKDKENACTVQALYNILETVINEVPEIALCERIVRDPEALGCIEFNSDEVAYCVPCKAVRVMRGGLETLKEHYELVSM